MGLLILARVSKLSFSVDGEKFGSVWANCRLDFFSNSICVILRNMKNYSKGFLLSMLTVPLITIVEQL